MNNPHESLIRKMHEHDWFFDYSDDQRYWLAGFVERRELIREFAKLDKHTRVYLSALVPESERILFEEQVIAEIGNEDSRE